MLRWLIFCGIAAGLAACCRTPNLIATGVICIASLIQFKWRGLAVCIPAITIVSILFISNYLIFGSWNGGYDKLYELRVILDNVESSTWSTPFWTGLFANLISPSRGILIFSPFLIFSFWGMFKVWSLEDPHWKFIALITPIPLLLLIVYSKYAVWWGGSSHYGPRYLIETYPFFVLFIAAIWINIANRSTLRIFFSILLAWSIFVQAVGAFCYPSDWAVAPVKLPEDSGRLWEWSNNQIFSCIRSGVKF